jgi:hypothetical protein
MQAMSGQVGKFNRAGREKGLLCAESLGLIVAPWNEARPRGLLKEIPMALVGLFHDAKLVSIQKWPFSAISASMCGIVCAAYDLYASAQSLDFLDFAKNCSFLNWKLELVPIVGDFHFRMGTKLVRDFKLLIFRRCVPQRNGSEGSD